MNVFAASTLWSFPGYACVRARRDTALCKYRAAEIAARGAGVSVSVCVRVESLEIDPLRVQ